MIGGFDSRIARQLVTTRPVVRLCASPSAVETTTQILWTAGQRPAEQMPAEDSRKRLQGAFGRTRAARFQRRREVVLSASPTADLAPAPAVITDPSAGRGAPGCGFQTCRSCSAAARNFQTRRACAACGRGFQTRRACAGDGPLIFYLAAAGAQQQRASSRGGPPAHFPNPASARTFDLHHEVGCPKPKVTRTPPPRSIQR